MANSVYAIEIKRRSGAVRCIEWRYYRFRWMALSVVWLANKLGNSASFLGETL